MRRLYLGVFLVYACILESCFVTVITRPAISGYVRDASTGEPIQGVSIGTVYRKNGKLKVETISDTMGQFSLKERRRLEIWINAPRNEMHAVSVLAELQGYEKDGCSKPHLSLDGHSLCTVYWDISNRKSESVRVDSFQLMLRKKSTGN